MDCCEYAQKMIKHHPGQPLHSIALPVAKKSQRALLDTLKTEGEHAHLGISTWDTLITYGASPTDPELLTVKASAAADMAAVMTAVRALGALKNCPVTDLIDAANTLHRLGQIVSELQHTASMLGAQFGPDAATFLLHHAQQMRDAAARPRTPKAASLQTNNLDLLADVVAAAPRAQDKSLGRTHSRPTGPAPGAPKRARTSAAAPTVARSRPAGSRPLPARAIGAAKAVKTKRAVAEYRHLPALMNARGAPFSKLHRPDGGYYVMTSTQVSGGSGKFREGYAVDGTIRAIKELRHQDKLGVDKHGRSKTYAVTRAEVYAEVLVQIEARIQIDNDMAFFDALPEDSYTKSLKLVRSGSQPLQIVDFITDDTVGREKTYLVMTLQEGDLYNLVRSLTYASRAAAARSFAYQVFLELASLHDTAGYMHGDLKLGNILWNGTGQMLIADFGFASAIKNNPFPLRGPQGSTMAPEMFRRDATGEFVPLTPATDVFAMGAMVAETAQSGLSPIVNPFAPNFDISRYFGVTDGTQGGKVFELFEEWKDTVRGLNGRVDTNKVALAPPSLFADYFRDLAFNNPELCDLAINDAMHEDPSQRLTASLLASSAAQSLYLGDERMQQLRQTMAGLAQVNDTSLMQKAAMAYDAFDIERTQQEAAKNFRPAHMPRPLPG